MTPKLKPLDKLTELPFPTLTAPESTLAILQQALQNLPKYVYICHALIHCGSSLPLDQALLKAYIMDALAHMVKDVPVWPHPLPALVVGQCAGWVSAT